MRIIHENSVSAATETHPTLPEDRPGSFEEMLTFDFSVLPPVPLESVGNTSTGSLLPPQRGFTLLGFAGANPFSESNTEPAGRVSAGSSFTGDQGEYNEPLGMDFDDFLAPSHAHPLSDWPL